MRGAKKIPTPKEIKESSSFLFIKNYIVSIECSRNIDDYKKTRRLFHFTSILYDQGVGHGHGEKAGNRK